MWAEPEKMDGAAVFRNALEQGGFDADRIFGLIETQEIKQELIRNTERSVERGTFGSPTFYVGNEIFFGKDRLSAATHTAHRWVKRSRLLLHITTTSFRQKHASCVSSSL